MVVRIKRIFLIICAIIFCISAGYLALYFIRGFKAESNFKSLKNKAEDAGYASLYRQNHDFIGWITIKDTKVDYPVMQNKKEPEYYLRRNFKKEYSLAGTPFMDAASDIKKPTSNWMIYGHNMKNGTMFEDLLDYSDREFYEKHKYIIFNTIYENADWEVIAAGKTQIYKSGYKGFKYYQHPAINSKQEFEEYIKGVTDLSEIDTGGVTAVYGEQLLTLSTCSYHLNDGSDDGRFIVVAKKIGTGKNIRNR